MQPKIVTVLKSGGEFTEDHVSRLKKQCDLHAPNTTFICLSDLDLSYGRKLKHDWSGWWSKMELGLLQGPALYMDLDTSIVGDLTDILKAVCEYDFIALRNPMKTPSKFGSGLMGWSGNILESSYERFGENPEFHMKRCTTQEIWGDQGFFAETQVPTAYWQDLFPGQILSWKVDCKGKIPQDARIVYFHGKPRPWDIETKMKFL